MNVSPTFERLRTQLWRLRAADCAVYQIPNAAHSEEIVLWGTHSPYAVTSDEHRGIDRSWRSGVLECLHAHRNGIVQPDSQQSENAEGEKWWGLIIATGPVRDAGYVLAVFVPATGIEGVQEAILTIEAVFNLQGGSESQTS